MIVKELQVFVPAGVFRAQSAIFLGNIFVELKYSLTCLSFITWGWGIYIELKKISRLPGKRGNK